MTQPLRGDEFPRVITTQRLSLRKPDQNDEDLFARLVSEAYRTRTKPLSVEQSRDLAQFAREHWERYGFGFMIMDVGIDAGSATSVGHAGFRYADAYPGHWTEDYRAIELGFAVIPPARGYGYVTEAARAVVAEARKVIDVATICASCDIDNPKSAAVLLRCGMTELEPSGGHRRFALSVPPISKVAL